MFPVNLLSKVDRKGQSITYVYDALNRLTKKMYPDQTEVDYSYDKTGRITGANDADGTWGFVYDNMGRQTSNTVTYTGLPGTGGQKISVFWNHTLGGCPTGSAPLFAACG